MTVKMNIILQVRGGSPFGRFSKQGLGLGV